MRFFLPQSMRPLAGFLLLAVTVLTSPLDVQAAGVEAFAGEPFGVARVTLTLPADAAASPLLDERFTLTDEGGRVLYPAVKDQPVRRLLRQLLDIQRPRPVTYCILFRGDEPFDMQAFTPFGETMHVVPQANPQAHRELMAQWWEAYATRWKSLRQDPQFPPVVENFLAANLARRLGMTLPEPTGGLLAGLAPKKTAMGEVLVNESHQLAIDQAMLAGGEDAPARDGGPPQPLPAPMPWYDLGPPGEELAGVAVEPMALHVPVECFYLRYGSFANYLWFRDLSRKWQGDLGNMIVRRGIDRSAADRIEEQLAVHESGLARILGPQVIEDVAMIGLDPYLAEGAAFGILFQAKNNVLLGGDLVTKRREALKTYPDATETTVRIADRDVSLIATPGREVRSYYIQDGDFHLVATSERLVQRFLQAGKGEFPLAGSTGFLMTRQRLPVERGDAIFAYISPEFFRELTSPAIWIESQRRAQSSREAKLVELARLQAAAEGVAATTREELIAADLLPPGFGDRSDGSALSESPTGAVDSVRGVSGRFTPVGDMAVENASAAEVAAYGAFTARWRQEVGQTPPIAIAIQRIPLADGSGETMAVEILATPLADVKLGRLPETLGEPSHERVAPIAGDLVRSEAVLNALLPLAAAGEPHHLFFGVRDFRTPLVATQGRLAPGVSPTQLVRMYVGAWPRPGFLRLFGGDANVQGPEPVPAGPEAWQARRDDFLLMSFKPDLVEEVLPQLQRVPVEQPAQAWLEIADLTGTDLAGTVSALGYMRTRETSVAACRLMNTLANQLHVAPEACREVAERLMDGTFVCPLGGEYQLTELPDGRTLWTSSALSPANQFLLTQPPEDFELPALGWFKGFRGELRLEKDELSAHVEIDMAKSAVP